jgi:hypothetical protein
MCVINKMGCTTSATSSILVCNTSTSSLTGGSQGIIGKNLTVLMREGKERTVLSSKIVEAIQKGDLKRLRQIIESQGGKDKVDFTAV